MQITRDAKIKVASLKEGTALRLTALDELECLEIIEQDLLLPPDAVFTRNSIAYKSDGTQVAANQPRFEQGQFGQAVMVEEGTANRIINALLVDSNSDGLADNWGQSNTTNRSCSNGVQTFTATTTFGAVYQSFNFGSATGPWSFSAEIKGLSGRITVYLYDASGNYLGNVNSVTVNNDQSFTRVTCSTTRTDVRSVVFRIEDPRSSGWTPISFRNPQIEVGKAYATSFVDGTRSPETLTIPTAGVLDENEFDITGWFIPAASSSVVPAWARIWGLKGVALTGLYINGSVIRFAWNNKEVINTNIRLSANDQLFYSVSKSGSNVVIRLAKNGGALSTFTGTTDGTTLGATEISLGSNGEGGSFYSGKHDDLRISSRARTDEEIAAAYASGQPLPIDEYTTYKLDFDDKIRITSDGKLICREYIEV